MKNLTLFLALSFYLSLSAQDTFSIVAVDSITGEIASAGATCGDSIIWPNTPGALIISEILPGIGAIHTQSYYNSFNQANARIRMEEGDSPEEIISWLEANDWQNDAAVRQYGVVDYNNGSPRSAAFTGENCLDHKNHIIGPNYAIQGNILIGPEILDSMEARFLREEGCLANKVMAAMQGAKVPGADSRCLDEGVSSLSAFIRVAQPGDAYDSLFLDINIAGTGFGVEPIDALQDKYDQWKDNNDYDCPIPSKTNDNFTPELTKVYPNPSSGKVTVDYSRIRLSHYILHDMTGRKLQCAAFRYHDTKREIDLSAFDDGIYLLHLYSGKREIEIQKVVKVSM